MIEHMESSKVTEEYCSLFGIDVEVPEADFSSAAVELSVAPNCISAPLQNNSRHTSQVLVITANCY